MPRAYPPDLRRRVVEAYERGQGSYEQIADRFGVERSTVNRWLRLVRETGGLAPRPAGGARHPRKVDKEGEVLVRGLLIAMPDSTLGELVETYAEERGVEMHERTMGRAVARMGFTRKRGV